jgi:2-oxoglutarate ferredoxin oxidoreductase subunit alpha
MTHLRQEKVDKVADFIPLQTIDSGEESGDLLLLGWGGTYGALRTATAQMIAEGYKVSHAQVRYINPFPKNLQEVLSGFDKILVPEMNCGQLVKLLRAEYLLPAQGFNKVQGLPFTTLELKNKIKEIIH